MTSIDKGQPRGKGAERRRLGRTRGASLGEERNIWASGGGGGGAGESGGVVVACASALQQLPAALESASADAVCSGARLRWLHD